MNHTKLRAYQKWNSMRQRCSNSKRDSFKTHDGRGIMVCARWQSFSEFYEDMGECPPGLTLERINNEGNYEPSNCCWASFKEQANNRRTSRLLTLNGITQTCAEWSEIIGISPKTIHMRLKYGWSEEKTLSQPLRKSRHTNE